MAPVEAALKTAGAEVLVWDSGQSPDLTGTQQAAVIWADGMTRGVASVLPAFRLWLQQQAPVAAVLVQGDTATAFACALTAWLEGISVGHVEAGLRTYSSEPFPEEGFRRMIAPIARWHFCPDEGSRKNLQRELHGSVLDSFWSPSATIAVTGNPLIDTLPKRPLRLLVTLHRRENWGARIGDALLAINQFCREHEAFATVIRHPNWTRAVPFSPEDLTNVFLSGPVPHERLLEMLESTDLIVTDSGGLSEEAAHYGVPCLILRTATERKALEEAGAVEVIDPDRPNALAAALAHEASKRKCYGAGDSGARIARLLMDALAQPAAAEDAA
jgi:UDP-N-acetylglucosamine 2-epimerase (non-hydrolysing)